MARRPMVTRTITTTSVNFMALDIEKGEATTQTLVLPRVYNDDKKLLKAVQEQFDTDTMKAVHIVNAESVETLYGMTEQDFIENAFVLDPTTRKALAEAEEN